MSWNPYAALGLSSGASQDEIKRAYRKLAKELHPDVRPNDPEAEERFKRASAAFNLLSDPEQRKRFDLGEIDADGNQKPGFQSTHFGGGGHSGGGFGSSGFGGFPGGSSSQDGAVFEDLFDGLFGGRGGGRGRGQMNVKGQDIRYTVELDFIDAVNGARRRFTMADGKTLDVNIPAGIKTGQTLRLKSQGQPSPRNGPPGDALLEVSIKPSDRYRREGNDLYMDLPISLTEAVEGAKVPVETPQGRVQLNVPSDSNSGSILRLKGKGVQTPKTSGNLYVKLVVTLPKKADSELKDFVKNWAKRGEPPAGR